MSRYQETLAAFGISDEEIRLHVLDNDIGLFRNRDSAAYGRAYEREQMADHPDNFTEGFAFKYGVERDAD